MTVGAYAPRRYARPLVAGWLLTALLAAGATVAFLGGRWDADPVLDARGWRTVATLADVRSEGVVALPELRTFLVAVPEGADGETAPDEAQQRGVMALYDYSQHLPGERVSWCESAQVFWEKNHGAIFDRFGAFVGGGPASNGLDRVAVSVVDGKVQINPSIVLPGPEKGDVRALQPTGPFCQDF